MDEHEKETIDKHSLMWQYIKRKKQKIARRKRRRFFGCLIYLLISIAIFAFIVLASYTVVRWGGQLYHAYQSARQGYEQRQEAWRGPIDPKFDAYTNVLVLGIDDGADAQSKGSQHADVVLLASTENATGKVRFVSIPPNTWVAYPNSRRSGRISGIYQKEGAAGMVRAVNQLLGISVHQYIILDMKTFSDLMDVLGGINVYVEGEMNYEDKSAGLSIHLKQGYQHLSGEQAQEYLRYRSPELGEVGRVQRQQKFLKLLYKRILKVDTIPKLPQIAEILKNDTQTSAEIFDSAHLANVARSLSKETPTTLMLPGDQGKGDVWLPDTGRIEEKIQEFFPPETSHDDKEEQGKK